MPECHFISAEYSIAVAKCQPDAYQWLDILIVLPLQVRRERTARHMKLFTLLSFCVLILWPSHEAWSQKSLPTVRIGIEAVAGTNSHYYVTKQLGLFQKHGLNLELISFPGGTVGLQSLLAGEIQFATADGVAGAQTA